MAAPEVESPEFISRLNRMYDEMMAKIGLSEGKNDIVKQCGSVRLRIFEAGEYTVKEGELAGTKKKFEEGVELRQGGLVLHLEPSDIAILIWTCQNDPQVQSKLNERLEKEKKLMSSLGF